MDADSTIRIRTREELRDWLSSNSGTERGCWIHYPKKPDDSGLTYLDIVEEAICFGWIDSTRKSISDDIAAQRISPRRKDSNWTELNKERARRLERLGLMTDDGRKCLPNTCPFVLHPDVEAALKEDPEVYERYLDLPDLYRRVRIDNIHSCIAAEESEIYEKRLKKFIENTKQGKLYGDWHDGGRLLDR